MRAKEALVSPLLDVRIQGAKGVLFYIAGDTTLTLLEVSEAAKFIGQSVDPEANIIFGVKIDPHLEKEIRLTLIATGFASKDQISGLTNEREVNKLLKSLKSDEDLAVPAYMRFKSTPTNKA